MHAHAMCVCAGNSKDSACLFIYNLGGISQAIFYSKNQMPIVCTRWAGSSIIQGWSTWNLAHLKNHCLALTTFQDLAQCMHNIEVTKLVLHDNPIQSY